MGVLKTVSGKALYGVEGWGEAVGLCTGSEPRLASSPAVVSHPLATLTPAPSIASIFAARQGSMPGMVAHSGDRPDTSLTQLPSTYGHEPPPPQSCHNLLGYLPLPETHKGRPRQLLGTWLEPAQNSNSPRSTLIDSFTHIPSAHWLTAGHAELIIS